MNIKLNDVYQFNFNETELKERFEPYWCFDGILIVENVNDELYLFDTYWSGGERKKFTLEDVNRIGKIELICNLDDVELKTKDIVNYYDDTDIIILYCHKGHNIRYYLKKGAKKSKNKMLSILTGNVMKLKNDIIYYNARIEQYEKMINEVQNDNLEIYI